MIKKAGFTLAEVLIALAVIGIVAVLTIPNVVHNYKKQVTSARLKKFYSTMHNAIRLSEITNGPIANWEFTRSELTDEGVYDYEANDTYTVAAVKKYFAPYLKFTQITEGSYIPASDTESAKRVQPTMYFNDGSSVWFQRGDCLDINYDTNGDKKPNKTGYDRYYFTLCTNSSPSEYKNDIGFKTYLNSRVNDRAHALRLCSSSSKAYCSVLLEYDNWEFKSDYPYEL